MRMTDLIIIAAILILLGGGIGWLTNTDKERNKIEQLERASQFQQQRADSLHRVNKSLLSELAIKENEAKLKKQDYDSFKVEANKRISELTQQLDTGKTSAPFREYAHIKAQQIKKLESAYANLDALSIKKDSIIHIQAKQIEHLNKVLDYRNEQLKSYEKMVRKKELGGAKGVLFALGAFVTGMVLGMVGQ